MKKLIILSTFSLLTVVLIQCKKEESPELTQIETIEVTQDMSIGRVLFYDKKLSINNTISCASCHKQSLAFADDVAFSRGYDNRFTSRNSMPIQNLSGNIIPKISGTNPGLGDFPVQTELFWDGRENDLGTMVLKPLVNHIEMGVNNLNDLASKLSQIDYYQEMFMQQYGVSVITPEDISRELTSFVGSLNSDRTQFDLAFRKGFLNLNELTAEQRKGWELFNSKYDCNSCHQIQTPNGYQFAGTFANIGLNSIYDDPGLGAVTENTNDIGKFKIPSLRNVALTAPYMHDGRFSTLDEVMDHYAFRIASHPNLDHRLKGPDGSPIDMNIAPDEKEAIIAFLHTLTDHEMISDPQLSNPFKVVYK